MSNTENKINVLFILPTLTAGGAQRVMSFVSQNLNKNKFNSTLLIAGHKKDSAYNTKDVHVVYLNKSRIFTALPYIIKYIFYTKPNVVISSISHTNTAMSLIAPIFNKTKFIGREATILSQNIDKIPSRKYSPFFLIPNKFKNLDMMICQSEDMAVDMVINYNIPSHKIKIINNPISFLPPLKKYTNDKNHKKFITIGRLTEVKGHLRILEILSHLKFPYTYTIIGEGIRKDIIFNKAKELNIYSKIHYIPFTNNVYEYLANNDMFLQGSFVEGFPNALLESCVVGTPAIAFDVPGGTKEIIENDINGFLVQNNEEFLEKLNNEKVWDAGLIRESVLKKFSEEKIIRKYEDLIIETISFSNVNLKLNKQQGSSIN